MVRTISKEGRYMSSAFYGVKMLCLSTKTVIMKLSALLKHYKTSTKLGTTMTAAIKHLHLDIVVSGNPLESNYDVYVGGYSFLDQVPV
jgi:hypothetical protein